MVADEPVAAEIPVIVNAASGGGDAAQTPDAVTAAFRAHGMEARIIVLHPDGEDVADIVDRLKASGVPMIVAGGGDGTVNAVASRLLDSDIVLGVLPLGTLNHFAKDLGIPLELDAAAAIIAAERSIAVDVGEANGRVFLNNSSLGLYPTIVLDREQAQESLGWGKWPALARATWHALRAPDNFNAVVCIDGEEIRRRTPFIFVGNNRYAMEGFGIGKRARLDEGVLSLYVLRPKTMFGLLWLGLRAMFGRASKSRDFDAFDAADFKVEAAPAQIEIATDGEVADIATPVRYRVRPRALTVIAPAADRVAATSGS